jgi:hypothetical protein
VAKEPKQRAYVALPDDSQLDDEAIKRVAAAIAKDMYRQLVGGDTDDDADGKRGSDAPK